MLIMVDNDTSYIELNLKTNYAINRSIVRLKAIVLCLLLKSNLCNFIGDAAWENQQSS